MPIGGQWCAGKVEREGEGDHETDDGYDCYPHKRFEGSRYRVGGKAAEEEQNGELHDADENDVEPFDGPGKLWAVY